MATEICLTISDTGEMTVSSETKEAEMAEGEGMEATGTPVKSIDEALQAIKAMAEEASMTQAPEGMDMGGAPPNEEESAMLGAFGKKQGYAP